MYPAFLSVFFGGLVVCTSLLPWLCLVPHLQSILLIIHGDHRGSSKLVDHGIPTLGRLGETYWKQETSENHGFYITGSFYVH